MTRAMHTRYDKIREVQQEYRDFYRISGGLGLIAIGVWLGTMFFSSGYATNIYTEFLSVVATIAVIDQLNRRRDMQERKSALFRQLKSRSQTFALDAIEQVLL